MFTLIRRILIKQTLHTCVVLAALRLTVLSVQADPNCVAPPSGLVGWWTGDGNASDQTGLNNGVLSNGAAIVSGYVGNAFQFNGSNSWVEVPDNPTLRLTNALTVEFWVKRSQLAKLDYIVEKGGDWTAGQQNFAVALHTPEYNHMLHFLFAGGYRGAGSIADFNWHHCAVVAVNGQPDPVFYIDGVVQPVLYRGGPATMQLQDSTRPLHIGAQVDPVSGYNYYSQAQLDEFSIYNRALSAVEIQAIYSAGSLGKCKAPPAPTNGLIAHYPFTGNANDASGNQRHGIVNNAQLTADRFGVANSAYQFANATIVATGIPINLAGPYTFSVWMNLYAFQHGMPLFELSDGGGCNGNPQMFQYNSQVFYAHCGSGESGLNPFGTEAELTNRWRQLVVSVENGTTSVYRDGLLLSSSPQTWPTTSAILLSLGGVRGYYAAASLDDVRLYNRALSSNEVQQLYLAESASPVQPPSIVQQSLSTNVLTGATFSLSATAQGTEPLSYQWTCAGTNLLNSSRISGATTSTLTIANAQPADSAAYALAVTNSAGSASSQPILVTVQNAACTPPPSGLVGWWTGDNNASDQTGLNSGYLSNGAAIVSGYVGNAFQFNGAEQYVAIPDSPSLNLSNAITVETWVYPTAWPSLANVIVSKDDAWGNRPWALNLNGSGFFYCQSHLSSGFTILSGSPSAKLNTWQHVAMTYDGATLKLYLNGVLDASQPATGTIKTVPIPVRIGSYAAAPTYPFTGRVDEPAIYSRALSAAEIQAIYSAGTAGKCVTPTPPMIVTQPSDRTVFAGGSVTFSATAAGTAPLSYQWNHGTNALPSGTNATLTLLNVQPVDAGNYSLTVTNALGATNSLPASLTVTPAPPAPTAGLVASYPFTGNAFDMSGNGRHGTVSGAQLGADRFGTANAAYQFANSTIVATGIPINLAGPYTFSVWMDLYAFQHGMPLFELSDGGGCNGNPQMFQYNSQVYYAHCGSGESGLNPFGTAAELTNRWRHLVVSVENGTTCVYRDGFLLSTSPQTWPTTSAILLSLGGVRGYYAAASLDDVRLYNRALSSNEVQQLYSGEIAPPIPMPPSIASQPVSQTVASGQNGALSVFAIGTGPLSYQWRFNETNLLTGATNSSLTISNAQHSDTGSYSVVITNELGSVTSSNALLTVIDVAPVIVSQPQSRSVPVGGTTTFSATASGSQPMSYQWRFNATNLIANATNASYLLTPVQATHDGAYTVVITNIAGAITSSVAKLTVTYPTAAVRLTNVTAAAGGLVSMPVRLSANGNENALGFSLYLSPNTPSILTFDSVILGSGATNAILVVNTNQLATLGRVGIAIALPAGEVFPAGTQEVAQVRLWSTPFTGTSPRSFSVYFSDAPTVKQLSSVSATSLAANYYSGMVYLTPSGIEGDTAPRPSGDREIAVTDWVQVGRFVAQLDTIASSNEFQRVDCAPRDARGDGQIKVTDWVQAGRYAAGLDPWLAIGGPSAEVAGTPAARSGVVSAAGLNPQLKVIGSTVYPGESTTIEVRLESLGTENAVGFSLNFDPAVFSYSGYAWGSNTSGLGLNANTTQSAAGQLGFALACPAGGHFAAGSQQLATVTVTARAAATPGDQPISLGDQPVRRGVSDANANELTAVYTAASLAMPAIPKLDITQDNQSLSLSWPAASSNFVLQAWSGADLSSGTWTNVVAARQTNNAAIVQTIPLAGQAGFYRLLKP